MSNPFLGEIRMVGFTFAPRGWAFCNGQLIGIAQNSALFSLLGTTYGGDGRTTFALPNMQSRVPMHSGQGPGLSSRPLGQQSGQESVTLISTQMPQHTHALSGSSDDSDAKTPTGRVPAATASPTYATTPNTAMNPAAIGIAGGSQPHENMPPFLVVNFVIALEGIFPSRN